MNDNQNIFVVGSGKTTSRVLSQPGGQCSIALGGWSPEELERQRLNREAKLAAEKSVVETSKENAMNQKEEKPVERKEVVEVKKEEKKAVEAPKQEEKKTVSSNSFASGANMNACNVLTDRPTSRVSMPPGGHTSLRLW